MGEIAGADDARRAEPGLRPADETPVLTVIVPVYNEVQTIDELLNRIVAAPFGKQVVVVDDGSTDGIMEVLEKWEGHPQVELLQHCKNRGKGAATAPAWSTHRAVSRSSRTGTWSTTRRIICG